MLSFIGAECPHPSGLCMGVREAAHEKHSGLNNNYVFTSVNSYYLSEVSCSVMFFPVFFFSSIYEEAVFCSIMELSYMKQSLKTGFTQAGG